MSILTKLISIFKFDIPKRLGRVEYFLIMLQLTFVVFLLSIAFMLPVLMLDPDCTHIISNILLCIFGVIYVSLLLVVGVPSQISRLHDLNISGWWLVGIILIELICNVGHVPVHYIFLASFLLLPGTKGPNKFGDLSTYIKKKSTVNYKI